MQTTYRMTFAFNEKEVLSEVIVTDKTDFAEIVGEALEKIEEDHSLTSSVLNLLGFSILVLERKESAVQ